MFKALKIRSLKHCKSSIMTSCKKLRLLWLKLIGHKQWSKHHADQITHRRYNKMYSPLKRLCKVCRVRIFWISKLRISLKQSNRWMITKLKYRMERYGMTKRALKMLSGKNLQKRNLVRHRRRRLFRRFLVTHYKSIAFSWQRVIWTCLQKNKTSLIILKQSWNGMKYQTSNRAKTLSKYQRSISLEI